MTSENTATQVAMPKKSDFQPVADRTYDVLLPLWLLGLDHAIKGSGWLWDDFWKGGNTLDAAINYLVVTGKRDEHKLVEKSLQFYNKKRPYPNSGHWRDDYGWWGNAFVNAYIHADNLGISQQRDALKQAALSCWKVLHDSAVDNNDYTPKKSMIGEGYCAWNDQSARAYDASNNAAENFSPTPNTVTNVGFWILAHGLHDITKDQSYTESARSTFLWFYSYYLVKNQSYLHNTDGLIRETVNPLAHHRWCPDTNRAWSADQTPFVYAALRSLQCEPYEKVRDHLIMIGGNLGKALAFGKGMLPAGDRVLHEYPTPGMIGNVGNFNDNYCTGPGVFMRYLGYCLPLLSETEWGKNLVGPFREIIVASANKAASNMDKDGLVRCWYEKDIQKTPYAKDYNTDPRKQAKIWRLAFQASALDLFVAMLRLYP